MPVVSRTAVVLTALFLLSAANSARATVIGPPNLISNGTFDTDLTDWTFGGTGSVVPGAAWDSEDGGEAWLGVFGTPGTSFLEQAFVVPADAHKLLVHFDFSFEGQDSVDPPDVFTALVDFTDTDGTAQTAAFFTQIGIAVSSFSGIVPIVGVDTAEDVTLRFSLVEGPDTQTSAGTRVEIDNVSVQSVGEPATLALLGLGLLGAGYAGRRRSPNRHGVS